MNENQKINRKILLVASFITSLIYIGWRIFFTIPTKYGLISFIAGISLVVAEAIGVLESFSHYRNLSFANSFEKPEIPPNEYPDVDVLIATHSESTDLLYKTVNGCMHMNYPDSSKVHIYICDDSDRKEMKELAEKMNVGYFGLSDNKFAKAGNLNNALSKTNSPLVATFDADMIPTQDFLMETVPYFFLPFYKKDEYDNWVKIPDEDVDKDYKIGFIQSPQSFYNADLFQYNLFAEKNIPNEQDYFFKEVNVGRNRTNTPIYAGSNTLISREALEEVGGINTNTITEDFATGIDIQEKGYTCYAIPKVLAHGLCPDNLKSLIKQRQRWGRGCVQTLRKKKFLFGDLPFRAKISYISCFLYWTTFIRRFIYIVSPILFTVFGIIVVETSLLELILIWLPSYLIYNRTLSVLSGKIRNQKWSNIVDTIIFPYMIIPIFAEILGIKLNKFAVTPKEKSMSKKTKTRYAIPQIILVIATFIGLFSGIKNMIMYKYIGNIILIYWLLVNLYFLIMAIFFMLGRINYRSEERFYSQIPVQIKVNDNIFDGITSDISENGMGVLLENPEYIPYDTETEISVSYLNYNAKFNGKVLHVTQVNDKWKYSIKITDIDEENRREYYQIVFDRDHTLPNKLNSAIIRDFTVNIYKRLKPPTMSNRKLPRIPLNTTVNSVDGLSVKILNFNYEYVLLSKDVGLIDSELIDDENAGLVDSELADSGLVDNENTRLIDSGDTDPFRQNSGGTRYRFIDNIELDLGNNLILKCKLVQNRENTDNVLYHIENWKEVSLDDRLRSFLLEICGAGATGAAETAAGAAL